MVTVVLALGAAIGWGTGDFLGGLKSRTVPLLTVLLVSQATSLLALLALAAVRGVGHLEDVSLGYAALAGIGEMIGVAALYRGLAIGAIGIVAPLAATAPAIPVLAGALVGELPGPVQWAGIGFAAAGVVISSIQSGSAGTSEPVLPSIGYGLLGALGFGTFFLAIATAGDGDVGWGLLVARLTSVVVLTATALLARHRLGIRPTDLPGIAVIGVLIVAADSMYAVATTVGMLAIAAVLGSLHSVGTISLARIYLDERLTKLQYAGVAIALSGVLTIAATSG